MAFTQDTSSVGQWESRLEMGVQDLGALSLGAYFPQKSHELRRGAFLEF